MGTTIATLRPGQSLISTITVVANGKVQAELVSFVDRGTINVTALFNKSDERFAQNKPRRAWQSGELSDIAEVLNLDSAIVAKLEALKEGESLEVNILNPKVVDNSGTPHQLFVKVLEYTETELLERKAIKESVNQSTKSIDYMLDNADKMAKKNPTTGEHVTVNGEYVFAETSFYAGKPTHKFVTESVAELAVAGNKPFSGTL